MKPLPRYPLVQQSHGAWGRCPAAPPGPRAGTTLTEILVTILITSIGLVSVSYLFPLAVLRSIQATQRTHATVLKHNVDTYVDASRWYSRSDARNFLSDPRFFVGADLAPGTTGVDDDGNGTTDDRVELGWSGTDDLGLAVVDPLGVVEQDSHVFPQGATGATAIPRLNAILPFGYPPGTPFLAPLPLASPGTDWTGYTPATFKRAAEELGYLRDSWTLRMESESVSLPAGPPTTVDRVIIPGIAATGIHTGTGTVTTSTSLATRVILRDSSGKATFTRIITRIDTSTGAAYFTEDDDADGVLDAGEDRNGNNLLDTNQLPTGFVPTAARVETQDDRYSWMLLVRRVGGDYRDIDLVVFFKRSFLATAGATDPKLNEEQIFTANPVAPVAPATVISQVTFTAKPPYAKRGGYVIATHNLETYRIQNISEDGLTMTLIRSDGNDLAGIPMNAANQFQGVFMRGIVDVYPLGIRTPW